MRVLYSTDAIHAAVRDVLTAQKAARRVVLAPYVGNSAASYLPNPLKMRIVCSLQPQATSARALQTLRDRGALIEQSPRLHMKVFWSDTGGCVIGSSNVSQNSLGKGGLIEAGVYFPPGVVDIERYLRAAAPRPVSSADLRLLQVASDNLDAKTGPKGPRSKPPTFASWFDSPSRVAFRLAIWWEDGDVSEASLKHAREVFGSSSISDHLTTGPTGARPNDWLLCFKAPKVSDVEWMRVDSVVPIPRKDPAYDRDEPFQAIQVFPSSHYPTPPFAIDKTFTRALRSVVADLRAESLDIPSMKPSTRFLGKLRGLL